MKIKDVTNKLAKIRAEYQSAYQKATEEKTAGMKRLASDFILNSQSYMQEKERIEFDFQVAIVKAQAKAAKEGGKEIDALRQQELSGIGRIDADAMSRVNALKGIPVTTIELQAVLDKYGSTNYWVQRAVSSLAEENGVSVSSLNGLAPSIDVRMSVLDQLQDQLNTMLSDYDLTSRTNEAARARYLYLNDDILERSCKIFDNHMDAVSDGDAATRAAAVIHAMSGEMSRAVAISNSLRNLRGKNARNELLFRLATDNTISDVTFTVAGVDTEVKEWKQGKAARYAESVKLSHDLTAKTDKEDIKLTVQGYKDRLAESGLENPFLQDTLKSVSKSNSAVADAVAEMNGIRIVDATTDTEE